MAGRRRAKHCCRGFTLRAPELGCKLDGLEMGLELRIRGFGARG